MSINVISRLHSITHDTEDLVDVRRELERGARLSARGDTVVVSFVVTFDWAKMYPGRRVKRPASINLYRDRGVNPQRVLDYAEESGSLHTAFRYLVLQRPDVEDAGEVTAVEMLLTEPRPDNRKK